MVVLQEISVVFGQRSQLYWDLPVKDSFALHEKMYRIPPEDFKHKIMSININRTYDPKTNIYEVTRQSWVLSEQRTKEVEFVFSEYRGIVRAIFKPVKWLKEKGGKRWIFEGEEVTDKAILDLYLNKYVPKKEKGAANPIKYFYPVS